MPAILIFGHDASLLESRAMLLRSRGYTVISVSRISEIEGVSTKVGLLILCHSLGEHNCAQALEIATRKWPEVRSIALVSSGKPPCTAMMPNVQSWESPAKLLAAVEKTMRPESSQVA